ncbi:MAG: hypothetical protein ABI846_07050 [Rudaea sp.]
MRTPLAFASLLLLAGCNYAPSTSITTTTVNGTDVLHSVVTEPEPGNAKFECAESASGRCNFSVFTRDCRSAGSRADTTTCTTRVLDEFTLARGESRELDGLPSGFRHCVSQERKPSAAECLN